MSGLTRVRPYANRPLLVTLSGLTVWFGESLPVALGVTLLAVTLAPLLVASLRPRAWAAPAIWLLPVAMLLLLALPISCLIHPRLSATGWLLAGRLVWSVAFMLTLATGPWRQSSARGWTLGLDPRCALVLASGALMSFVIPATNERSGTVAMFVPFALAMVLKPSRDAVQGSRWSRLLAIGALGLFVSVLAAAGSRGGVLAALGGSFVVLILRIPRPQRLRAGIWAAVLLMVLATVVLTTPAGRDVAAAVLTDGSPRGVSWEVATTGRPMIWQRARLMIWDAPWTGLGLGTFGAAAARLYPLPFAAGNALEDAHQFVLQTWIDIGPLGLLALGWLTARALWLAAWRAREPLGSERSLAAGAFGGLIAWTIFGLGDAVALGTVGNVAFWLLLGVSFTLEKPCQNATTSGQIRGWPSLGAPVLSVAVLSVTLLGAWVLGWLAAMDSGNGLGGGESSLRLAIERNRASVAVVRSVLGGRLTDAAMTRNEAVATHNPDSARHAGCHARWLAGVLAGAVGQNEERRQQWLLLLQCDDRYLDVMAVAVPRDRVLAQAAIRRHPTSARAWRWWADTLSGGAGGIAEQAIDPSAVGAWRRTIALAPRQGVAWRRLGDLLAAEQQWGPALDAYAASCTHGDPGANGCSLAGTLADHLGDPRQAVAFLARSRWAPARARAERQTQ